MVGELVEGTGEMRSMIRGGVGALSGTAMSGSGTGEMEPGGRG